MAAIAVIAAGAYGVAQVSAATDPANPRETLIQKLADTFHLDKSKVQAVFDQNRAENQASREQTYEDRLTQAVTDGKITSAQKDAILAENKKLKAEMEAARNDAQADRRTAMKNIRTEAQTWASQNNINEKWLMAGMGGHPRGGMGMGAPTIGQGPDGAVGPGTPAL